MKATRDYHGLRLDRDGKLSRLYNIWSRMKQRCFNKKYHGYHYYGGRGITVCKEWLDYLPFHNWAMSNGYENNLTLDRKDNNRNYEPGNCRWITHKEQQNNKSSNVVIEFNGKKLNSTQWSIELGFTRGVLYGRLNKLGWSIERALTTPLKK